MGAAEDSYARYLKGDDSAFEELVELYFENLILFSNGYLRDMHLAEDVALDTLLELMIRPRRFAFRSSLKTYLFSIARHKAIDLRRKREREQTLPLNDEAADIASLVDDVIANETRRRLHSAIAQLPDDMRSAVHLVYLEGMSYEDAARVLGKSRKQVDNLLSRAKIRLRNALSDE